MKLTNDMTVREITYEQTKPFILGIHYARRMPCCDKLAKVL